MPGYNRGDLLDDYRRKSRNERESERTLRRAAQQKEVEEIVKAQEEKRRAAEKTKRYELANKKFEEKMASIAENQRQRIRTEETLSRDAITNLETKTHEKSSSLFDKLAERHRGQTEGKTRVASIQPIAEDLTNQDMPIATGKANEKRPFWRTRNITPPASPTDYVLVGSSSSFAPCSSPRTSGSFSSSSSCSSPLTSGMFGKAETATAGAAGAAEASTASVAKAG